ncbi:MAG TPA: hypothetical protein VM328_00060 [Fimbriimonadaceae bacterium]|nr:hypothetical protein [Fimbriimonadaceae bacterium]
MRILAIVFPIVALGCSPPAGEVSAAEDQKIRDNLSRPLTAAELQQMGANAQAKDPGSAPAEPPPVKGPR